MKKSPDFPALLQSFFTQRLIAQRKASPHTIASYRDTFRLLLRFAQKRLHKSPSQLGMEDLNAPFLGVFFHDLEKSPRQWRPKPKPTSDGDSVILPLRGPGNPSTLRSHPAGAGHSQQAAASTTGRLFDSTGDQGSVGSA